MEPKIIFIKITSLIFAGNFFWKRMKMIIYGSITEKGRQEKLHIISEVRYHKVSHRLMFEPYMILKKRCNGILQYTMAADQQIVQSEYFIKSAQFDLLYIKCSMYQSCVETKDIHYKIKKHRIFFAGI